MAHTQNMKINSREALQTGRDLVKEFGSWSEVEKHTRRNKHGVFVVVRKDERTDRPIEPKKAAADR